MALVILHPALRISHDIVSFSHAEIVSGVGLLSRFCIYSPISSLSSVLLPVRYIHSRLFFVCTLFYFVNR